MIGNARNGPLSLGRGSRVLSGSVLIGRSHQWKAALLFPFRTQISMSASNLFRFLDVDSDHVRQPTVNHYNRSLRSRQGLTACQLHRKLNRGYT